ncbi:NASP-related protein sim3 [Neolecta irregularis DAH-3]|uniref:NASP-related protein sim3 n=1 Tax=Neolecta irregularis (strain DAH-3) TaxID=1198029 RepID=A0A1U7LQZ4_NEOID|nr:NASP-related protein sim3 [Neolecta irregularis DAH-3]|eukprot:OLL25077.1 NASP-related protein sim3 [Neolecta irregularis DAH-3]
MAEQLVAQGCKAFALKKYDDAADILAQAVEAVIKTNGEDSADNADTLLLYGKALFEVARQKSQVLGGGSPSDHEDEAAQDSLSKVALPDSTQDPRFHFEGDVESNEDENDEDPEQEDNGEEDFTLCWETLDYARVLYEKKTDHQQLKGDNEGLKATKWKLADVFDLLGEVSLESENFEQAITDLQKSLEFKKELHSGHSNILSEAYFKLALAYEHSPNEADRPEAIANIEHAINTVKTFIKLEEEKHGLDAKGKDKEVQAITEGKEMVTMMEQKLAELQQPPDSKVTQTLRDLLAQSGGASLREGVEALIGSANDLSGLVRKKTETAKEVVENATLSKRKEIEEQEIPASPTKRVRLETVPEKDG